jgi:hypothetical protein
MIDIPGMTDVWDGQGFWLGDPSNWSLGAPPTSGEPAEISGQCALDPSGSANVFQLSIDSRAELFFYDNSTLEVANGISNAGEFSAIGSGITVGGASLTNSGLFSLGNTALLTSDVVTVGSLTNTSTGSITVQGNSGSGATGQSTLDVVTSSSSTIDGAFSIDGDADLELPTGITTVASDGSLQIEGSEASVSLGSGATNSALSNLSDDAGVIDLEGNTANGFGGVTLSTTLFVGFTNESGATLKVDSAAGAGGSQVIFGGEFVNDGSLIIGNSSLGAAGSGGDTLVQVDGVFTSTGDLQILGNAASGVTNNASLVIGNVAPSAWSGSLQVAGDATLEYTESGMIRTIDSGASIEIDGAEAQILTYAHEEGGPKPGLEHLTANHGTLTLQGDSSLGAGGVSLKTRTAFTNDRNDKAYIDANDGDGGSTVSFGGAVTNEGTLDIGNTGLAALTKVTAEGLTNDRALMLMGSSSELAELIVNGAATNAGYLAIGAGGELDVTGSNSFTQLAGLTTVMGSLVASTITTVQGKVDFKSAITSGDGVGALDIGTSGTVQGTLQFDSSVDSSHTVDFISTFGTLALGDPHAFAGTIEGFRGGAFNDVIDLLHQSVTNLAYSGSATSGTLAVTLSGGATENLTFSGDYSNSFVFSSDGHKGTDIRFS